MNSRGGKQARRQVVRYDDDDDDDADCYNSYDHDLNYDNDDAFDDNDTFNDNDNIIFYVKAAGEGAVASRKV